jgi:D-amino-acid dehydrogenase
MKIAIIGAGAVGVTMAHALSNASCEVHVYEQGGSAAQGASFSHHGSAGPGGVQMMFDGAFLRLWLQSFFGKPLNLHWTKLVSFGHYRRVFNAVCLSRQRTRTINAEQLAQLANYSDSVADAFVTTEGVTFEQGTGLLALHTSERSFDLAREQVIAANAAIALDDQKIQLLTPEQARLKEPSLNEHADLLGAVFYPNERYGNCALFTKQLKRAHDASRVQYFFNQSVTRLESEATQWRVHATSKSSQLGQASAQIPRSTESYDAVIVAAGQGTAALMGVLGVSYPLISTHAYCLALPIKEPLDAPRTSILDVAKGTRITPIGQRLRVSGHFQLAGKTRAHSSAYKALNKLAHHWFPFASKSSEAVHESSASCVAIDSKPIVGATHLPGLYVNFAHGPNDWALSFGCAQALADTIMKQSSAFDLKPFSPQRFA